MTINHINHATYESDDVVENYQSITLQPPEIMIFYKYKDAIYNKSMLDIGCGAGRTTHYLSRFTNQYRAVDYSEKMVHTCHQTYPDVNISQNDVRDLSDFDDASFDCAMFSYNGIDYLDHESRLQGLREIHRVLKDDGLFIFSTHNRDFLDKLPCPEFEFSLNPIGLLRNLKDYIAANKSYRKNHSMQDINNEFQIIVDPSNGFRLLTYYISIEKQLQQLQNIGLKVIDLFDLRGNPLDTSSTAKNSCWVYYVVRKQ